MLIWKIFKRKPFSKPNLNRLFIGYFERKTCCLNGNKNILERKKINQNYFHTDFEYCFRGIFKNWYPQSRLDKQNAINIYSQRKEISRGTWSRHSPFYKGTSILGVEPSRQKCLRVLINLTWFESFNYFVVNPKENWKNLKSAVWNEENLLRWRWLRKIRDYNWFIYHSYIASF